MAVIVHFPFRYLPTLLLVTIIITIHGPVSSEAVELAYSETPSNSLEALGNFLGVTETFVDVARKNEIVQDSIKIHNQMTESIEYECDFLNGGNRARLLAGQTVETYRTRQYGEGYWTCCQFIRTRTNETVPPYILEQPVYRKLAIELFGKSGKARNVFLKSDGIFIYVTPGEDVFESRGTGLTRHLAQWDSKLGYAACPARRTGYLLLRGTTGLDCIGECRRSYNGKYDWCYANFEHGWDYCRPKSVNDYNIRNYAKDNVLTTRGIPCRTRCGKWEGTNYNWCVPLDDFRIGGTIHTWDYCSVSPGFDYKDRKCTGVCSYDGHNYKWCYTQGGSWGYC